MYSLLIKRNCMQYPLYSVMLLVEGLHIIIIELYDIVSYLCSFHQIEELMVKMSEQESGVNRHQFEASELKVILPPYGCLEPVTHQYLHSQTLVR